MRLSATGPSGTLTVDRVGRYALDHRYPKLALAGRGEALEIDAVQLASAGSLGDAALRTRARVSLSAGSIRWRDKARDDLDRRSSVTFRTIPAPKASTSSSATSWVRATSRAAAARIDGNGSSSR
jgi:hypothetical protein